MQGMSMKDSADRAKCIDKVLSKHTALEVMEGLADVAFDVYQLGLRDRSENMSVEDARRFIKELDDLRDAARRGKIP